MEQARLLALCPECGWTTDPLAPLPRAGSFWRRHAALLAVLLTLVAAGVWLVRDSKWTAYSTGASSPQLVEPAITREQLQTVADLRAISGSELATRIRNAAVQNARSAMPGTWGMYVGWTVAEGNSVQWLRIGWPASFAEVSTHRVYQDVVAKSGWTPCYSDQTARPMGRYEAPSELPRVPPRQFAAIYAGTLHICPPPERTGGAFREINIGLLKLAIPAGFIALAAVVVPWIVRPLIRRMSAEGRRRWLWLASPLLAAMLMLALIVTMTVRTATPRDMVWPSVTSDPFARPPWPAYATRWKDFAQIPLSASELDALIATGDADRQLARVILDLPGTGDGKYLTIAGHREGVQTMVGTRLRSFASSLLLFGVTENLYVRRPDMGIQEPMTFPAGLTRVGTSRLRWSSGDPSLPVTEVYLYYQNLVPAMLVLFGFSIVARWVSIGRFLRQCRRRRRACQCVACGYSVRADPSTTDVSPTPTRH